MATILKVPLADHAASIKFHSNTLDIAEKRVTIMSKAPQKMIHPGWASGFPQCAPEIS